MFLLVASLLAATYYTFNLPKFALDHQQTVVLGPTQFAPENPSALRVVIRDNETNQPIANANVTVQMVPKGGGASQTLYTGKTDARGTAPVSFVLPANTARDQTLIIETNSDAGRDRDRTRDHRCAQLQGACHDRQAAVSARSSDSPARARARRDGSHPREESGH